MVRPSTAIPVVCFVVYFFGNLIFKVLGITVSAVHGQALAYLSPHRSNML